MISGRRNSYRPREIKMRMIRFGKRDGQKYLPSPPNKDSPSLNHTKRDFWLPSGFWWPKDSSHQRFVKFLYLFKNTRPEEMIKKKKVKTMVKKNNLSIFPMPRTWQKKYFKSINMHFVIVRFMETLEKYLDFIYIVLEMM